MVVGREEQGVGNSQKDKIEHRRKQSGQRDGHSKDETGNESQEHGDGAESTGIDAVGEPPGKRTDGHIHYRIDHHHRPDMFRTQAFNKFQVKGDEKVAPRQEHQGEQSGKDCKREIPVVEDPQVKDGVAAVSFPEIEDKQGYSGNG
jgi:hypothetical protein